MPNYDLIAPGSTPGNPRDFTTQSGKICRIRDMDPEDLIILGVLDKVDVLSQLVNDEHVQPAQSRERVPQDRAKKKPTKAQAAKQAKKENEEFFDKIQKNPEQARDMFMLVDMVLATTVIAPTVHMSYRRTEDGGWEKIPSEDRDPEIAYVDAIKMNDRFEVFGQVMGQMENLKEFRQGSEQDMDPVAAVADDEVQTE